jgi:hypothetical protein
MAWLALVPGPDGHLIPTHPELAPPLRWFDDDGVLRDMQYDQDEEEEKTPEVKALSTVEVEYEEVNLSNFEKSIINLLKNRKDLIEKADYISNRKPISRTEIIDSLATGSSKWGEKSSASSLPQDNRVLNIIEYADKLTAEAQQTDKDNALEAQECKRLILKADRCRHLLPSIQCRIIELLYYRRISRKNTAKMMKISTANLKHNHNLAIKELAEFLKVKP